MMARGADKQVASNDEEMWSSYHTSKDALQRALHVAKETIVCRLFARTILAMARRQGGPKIGSVLELACGTASTLEQIRKKTGARCVGIDRSAEAIDLARARHPQLDLRVGDMFGLDRPASGEPERYNLVYSIGLLEHFTRAEQRRLLEVHEALAQSYVALMVPADGILMNTILYVNKELRGKTGTWADEEVFSPKLLNGYFPQYRFDARWDRRFANLILWFGWRPSHLRPDPHEARR